MQVPAKVAWRTAIQLCQPVNPGTASRFRRQVYLQTATPLSCVSFRDNHSISLLWKESIELHEVVDCPRLDSMS